MLCVQLIHPVNSQFIKQGSDPLNQNDEIYAKTPDWISENPHYSTGAELADINQDGWLDLVVADGNDMGKGHVKVYLNNQGSFPTEATWQSDDKAYNGHLDIADVNGDGWPDVAVSHLGTSSTQAPIARLYLNNQGSLSTTPDWEADVIGNAFGVDFGDMNNDGRPDLAIATGWSYSPKHPYHNYVYLNVDGMLDSSPSWISDDMKYYQGVLWVDANDDGWLDLIGSGTEDQIYLYKNNNGILDTTASWNTEESFNQDGIMLTAGDVTGDGIIDLFATDNVQLGGSGLFRQYTGITDDFFEKEYSWNYYGGMGSAVALADINGDNKLDLATGAWWSSLLLFINNDGSLSDQYQYYSEETSVIEKIVFGDIGPDLTNQDLVTITVTPSTQKNLFYLPHQPIQYIEEISCDGVILSEDEYTFSREHGWVTINKEQVNTVEINYYYSKSLDMIYTNWDANKGNFLYYHSLPFPDLQSEDNLQWHDVKPGSTVTGELYIQNQGDPKSSLDWKIRQWPEWGEWTFSQTSGSDLTPDQDMITVTVEIQVPEEKNTEFDGQLVIVNQDDETDNEHIQIQLTTAKPKNNLFEWIHQLQTFIKQKTLALNQIIQLIRDF